jgi:hypothetical protein
MHGPGAASKPVSARPVQVPPLESPEIPASEVPPDLAEPGSVPPSAIPGSEARDYNPESAAAEVGGLLEQLSATADARKARVRGHTAQVAAEIAADGESEKAAMSGQIAVGLAGIRKQVSQLKAEVASEAAAAKAVAAAWTSAGQAGVLLKTLERTKAIEASAVTHKKQATAAVLAERAAVRKYGADEGKRGKRAMQEQSDAALERGRAKAATYSADKRGRVQASAAWTIANQVAAKLVEPADDLESKITESGEDLAKGVADADEQLGQAIDQQTPKITAELFSQSNALSSQFETIRMDVSRAADDFLAETNKKLDEVEQTATAELGALESFLGRQVDASVAQVQALLGGESEALIASIDNQVAVTSQAARAILRPYIAGIRAVVAATDSKLERAVGQFDDGLLEFTTTAHAGLAAGGASVSADIAGIGANVASGLASVHAPTQKSFAALADKAKEGSDRLNDEWQKILTDAQQAVDAKWDESIAAMVKEIEKNLVGGKLAIKSKVDEAVAKNREPLNQLDSQMDGAAKTALEKYDAPWYKKVGRWLWHALTSFLEALAKLVLLVVVLIALVILLIVGIVFDVVVLIVIAVVAIVAVIGYVLYEIGKGWWARVKSAENIWEAAWAGVVGLLDIVGIPGVIEGIVQHDIVNGRELSEEEAGDRFGAGALGVLTLILPAKLKAGGIPAEVPRVPVEIPLPTEAPVGLPPIDPPSLPPPEVPAPEVPHAAPPFEAPKTAPPPEAPTTAPPPEAPKTAPPPEAPKTAPPAEAPKNAPPPEAPAQQPPTPRTAPTGEPPASPPPSPPPKPAAPAEAPHSTPPTEAPAPDPAPTDAPPTATTEAPAEAPADSAKATVKEAQAQAEVRAEAEVDAEPESEADAEPESKPEAEPDPKAEAEALKRAKKNARAKLRRRVKSLQPKVKAAEAKLTDALARRNAARALKDSLNKPGKFAEFNEASRALREAEKDVERAQREYTDQFLELKKATLRVNKDLRSRLPCFAADTLVWTPAGPRQIQHLEVGDQVLAYDFGAQACQPRQVLEVYQNLTLRFYRINVGAMNIRATSQHRFWIVGEGAWVEARHLQAGMQLLLTTGCTVAVAAIEVEPQSEAPTYNLHIEGLNTYFVGPGALVHNQGSVTYKFGNLRIYAGTNPKFPGKVYIGQTDDLKTREGQHHAEAEKELQRPDLTPEEREFWEFKRDMVLEERVGGLDGDQANYLEQKNIELETQARGAQSQRDVMNRREQVSRENMKTLEERIKADPAVQEEGLCP